MTSYGQFCPVAKAMELLDERWTILIVRELLLGSRHFNELRRGVPKMSPALLTKRLRSLERAGVINRSVVGGRSVYTLTTMGEELATVVEALSAWGIRWIGELGDADLDPHLLMWDMHRTVRSTGGRDDAPWCSSSFAMSSARRAHGGWSSRVVRRRCATSTPVTNSTPP